MQGITNLTQLLATMQPVLQPGVYVFCTISDAGRLPVNAAVMQFREQEGYTVILEKSVALALGLSFSFEASWITLQVHSALSAVGLTAAVATCLTQVNISCNVVARFYHDHLFVPVADAQRAVLVLSQLSASHRLA